MEAALQALGELHPCRRKPVLSPGSHHRQLQGMMEVSRSNSRARSMRKDFSGKSPPHAERTVGWASWCPSGGQDGSGTPCMKGGPERTGQGSWTAQWGFQKETPPGRRHAPTDAHAHARTHAPTDARTHAPLHARTHGCTHARTHAGARAPTHATYAGTAEHVKYTRWSFLWFRTWKVETVARSMAYPPQ